MGVGGEGGEAAGEVKLEEYRMLDFGRVREEREKREEEREEREEREAREEDED